MRCPDQEQDCCLNMTKIEFIQPKHRIEDWCVKLNGRTVGSVWRCGECYLVVISTKESAPTKDAAFKAARKQLKSLAVA